MKVKRALLLNLCALLLKYGTKAVGWMRIYRERKLLYTGERRKDTGQEREEQRRRTRNNMEIEELEKQKEGK